MSSLPIPGNRVPTTGVVAPEPTAKSNTASTVPQASDRANHEKSPSDQPMRQMQLQQGRSRAAGLRQALEQNAAGIERKTAPAAGTVIRYPTEAKISRRQRAEHGEDVIPLDEEIHQLNGSCRNVQQDRKQVLAQRRQANRGFKTVILEHNEPADDLVAEGWGDDH